MAYSADDIFSQYRKTFVISPFKPRQVTPLGYDLSVGCVVIMDEHGKEVMHEGTSALPRYVIPARGSAIVVTLERLCLSGKVLGAVHARARLSMRGLMMNAVTVDPNFGFLAKAKQDNSEQSANKGSRLLLRVNNFSHLKIELAPKGECIATLVLHEVNTETKRKPNMKDMDSLIKQMKTNMLGVVADSSWTYITEYLDKFSKPTDKVEEEFWLAIEDMLHYRDKVQLSVHK